MKKITITMMVLALITINAFAQQPTNKSPRKQAPMEQAVQSHGISYNFFNSGLRTEEDCDTFGNLLECDVDFYVYYQDFANPLDSGYVSGHNAYLDKAKAEYYNGIPGDSLRGLWMWFGAAKAATNTPKITMTVWDDDGAGGTPGTVLATKQVAIKTIQNNINDTTTNGFYTVTFAHAIANPGTFYAGFSMTYTGGVFDKNIYAALVNNSIFEDCPGDTSRNTAWEQWSDNSWHAYKNVYGGGWTNMVFPIVCAQASCTLAVTPSSATVCKKKSVTLTASGADNYTWAPSTGLNTTVGPVVVAKPNNTTTYTVTGTTTGGASCTSTVTVTVNPIPTINLVADACTGGHVVLHSNSNPNTGVKYKWYKNGVAISGATQANYTATTSGAYKVKVTITATSCAKTSPETNVVISCREAESLLNQELSIEAYPNPFTSSFSITLNSTSSESGFVTLSDYSGKVIREYSNIDPSRPFEINENLAPGVYFISVTQGTESRMLKVVKSN